MAPRFSSRQPRPVALFPQILWLRGSDCYAPLLTRRGGGKVQGADLGMFLSDQVNQVLCLCLFRLSVEARVKYSKNQSPPQHIVNYALPRRDLFL